MRNVTISAAKSTCIWSIWSWFNLELVLSSKRMIRYGRRVSRMLSMSYLELLFAALAAVAFASVVYVGSAAANGEDFTTLDVDMASMTGMFTFVSMLVAQHPEWVT